MSSQVYLNPLRLSIISIPREKVWIFASAILQLLNEEAQHTPRSSFESQDENSSDDDSSDSAEDSPFSSGYESESDSKMMSSTSVDFPMSRKASLCQQTSKTDNSSKNGSTEEALCPKDRELSRSTSSEHEEEERFFHIAYTPNECTVICSTKSISKFKDPLTVCAKLGYDDVIIIDKTYLNLQVDSEGEFNNSAKILELTKPLSQHNISLFFLSNHFTNIVLIPYDLKDQVVKILTESNFEFSDVSNSYILTTEIGQISLRDKSFSSLTSGDLSVKTRELLKSANVKPKLHRRAKLLLTGARPAEVKQSILKASSCVAANTVPDYFAITRSSFSEVSLILPGSAKKRISMGYDFKSIVGSSHDLIIPITVDLKKLPLDSTGIVAGLASSLWNSVTESEDPTSDIFEMNYLSMARSAVVMIPQENLAVIVKMLDSWDDDTSTDE